MASVNGVSSSSYSSIYGSRGANIVSGLASGLDTESMIENSVKGYQAKIQELMNQQTKLTWKQDAVRNITDQLIALSEKYTSYNSKTNLASASFFNKAIKTITGGRYADKVTATGRTNSDIKINRVDQLATAARYQVDLRGLEGYGLDTTRASAASAIDTETKQVSDVAGTLTLKMDNTTIELELGESDLVGSADELASLFGKKLAKAVEEKGGLTFNKTTYTKAEADGNGKVTLYAGEGETPATISFTADASGQIAIKGDNLAGGASVAISGVSGGLADTDGPVTVETAVDSVTFGSITVKRDVPFSHKVTAADRLSNQRVRFTLDGESTEIALGDYSHISEDDKTGLKNAVLEDLRNGLSDNFGSKITADWGDNGELVFKLSDASSGSILKVTSEVGETLGIGAAGVTNYLNTGKTLGGLLGVVKDSEHGELTGMTALDAAEGDIKVSGEDPAKGTDKDGNSVMQIDGKWKRVDEEGNLVYAMNINGKQVGAFTKETTLEAVFSAINNSDAGVKVSYSQLSSKLTFTSTKTGAQSKIEFGDEMSKKLFVGTEYAEADRMLLDKNGNRLQITYGPGEGAPEGTWYITNDNGKLLLSDEQGRPVNGGTPFNPAQVELDPTDPKVAEALAQAALKGYTAGQDAIVNISVNGEEKTLVRSSNVIDMDGMSVTVKDVFDSTKDAEGNAITPDPVTFTTRADADTVVDAIKSFVEQINTLMKDIRDAYTTKPLSTTTGSDYEPLSDEEKADLSESELKAYEEKAKTGLLFGDSDLGRLYDSLRRVISSSGMDVAELRDIGLTTTYESGLTTLSLNEEKLRDALASDPDKVRLAFSKTVEGGAGSDGLMYNLKKVVKQYASTSIGAYGVLVKKAGTKTKSLTLNDNTLQKQIDNYQTQIEKWKLKMSDKIDYYTHQFSLLEQLMSQMNSQSSTLAGLMGGG